VALSFLSVVVERLSPLASLAVVSGALPDPARFYAYSAFLAPVCSQLVGYL
jgi:hypothetical protein